MDNSQLYHTYRDLLFAIAYRKLGMAADAEDIVQETFADLLHKDFGAIADMKAYLAKIVYNKCNDYLRGAVKERQAYVGPWMPEPLLTDLDEQFVQQESLSTAYLLLLQELNETERMVFILRSVGEFNYKEIAYIVEKSEEHCRQIYHRAKKTLDSSSPVSAGDHQQLKGQVQLFVHALQNGNLEQLLEVLTDDAVFMADSGGKVRGARVPVQSSARVAQFLLQTSSMIPPEMRTDFMQINGSPGIVLSAQGNLLYVFTFSFRENRIQSVHATANPAKLKFMQCQLGMQSAGDNLQ